MFKIAFRFALLAVLCAASFELGRYLTRPTYNGPPVAGFTTGGMRCSPICGHAQ